MAKIDLAVQTKAIHGRFDKEQTLRLHWLPSYMDEFPSALSKVATPLEWKKPIKFTATTKVLVPEKHGVYCFSVDLGQPFPTKIHMPLYIGKAATQYLSERYENYLSEIKKPAGREQIVITLNRYKGKLLFWWIELPRVYVDIVEEHLIMCCMPPCNTKAFNKERLWGKAFD